MSLKGLGLFEVISSYLPGGAEETHESLMLGSVLADIPSEHLPNTGTERYRLANPLRKLPSRIF
jgi:hypothetical protein